MTIKAQLTLSDGEQTLAVEVSSDALAVLAANLPDTAMLTDMFDMLAQHPDFKVRNAIAGMENLPPAAIRRLVDDSSMSVVKKLLKSKKTCEQLSAQEVLGICQRDPELAGTIAAGFEDFNLDGDAVITLLEKHSDTYVRTQLAGNPFAPNQVLRRIGANDPDEMVRQIAKDILA